MAIEWGVGGDGGVGREGGGLETTEQNKTRKGQKTI